MVFLAVAYLLNRPDGKTRVVFCDVGQGDGAIIVRGKFQMLLDVGPDNGKMEKCLNRWLPFWDRKIEAVVISHWDNDHSGGLEKLKRGYQVEKIYSPKEQKNYPNVLRTKDILRYEEMEFEVVSPGELSGDDNRDSIVGVWRLGEERIWFMGDVPAEVEQRMVWREEIDVGAGRDQPVEPRTMLKVSHHGSKEGTSEEWLEAIKPDLAVISVGKNSFGHPDSGVVERLEKYGVKVKRTDELGEVVLVY